MEENKMSVKLLDLDLKLLIDKIDDVLEEIEDGNIEKAKKRLNKMKEILDTVEAKR